MKVLSIGGEKKYMLKFEEKNWGYKQKGGNIRVDFIGNKLSMDLDLSEQSHALYLESSLFPLLDFQKECDSRVFEIALNAQFKKSKLSVFIVEFNQQEEKIYSKSYRIREGNNRFLHFMLFDTVFFKVLFRFENNEKDNITVENLIISTEDTFQNSNDYVSKLHFLDKKYYLLITSKKKQNNIKSVDYLFKPRSDVETFEITLPLEWDIDPFHDNNWRFQLHALRFLDEDIHKYFLTKDIEVLEKLIHVVLDWKRYVIDQNHNMNFDKEDDRSFAWHDMATGLRAMKLAFLYEVLVKLENKELADKYLSIIYELLHLHIVAFGSQKIAPGNHAIFQIHGLMMLLRLVPDHYMNIIKLKKQTEMNMSELFYKQFFHEGIHKENSANYHSFILNTFSKILSEDIYINLGDIFQVIDLAYKNCAYMHFPNLESLMTGDSDYKIAIKEKEEQIAEGITFFKESGYTYVYEQESESMLHLNTAFLNRAHKHADFFNILLYEYGKHSCRCREILICQRKPI